jgi:RNA polymerase sigma-70 factor (ECF subfamily)
MHISRAEQASLVTQAKLGDTNAFNQLVAGCYGKIRSYVASQHDLFYEHEDITQDVFLKAFENFASFRGESSFATWVRSIAYHLVRHRRRKLKNSVSLVPLFENINIDKEPETKLEYEELSEQLSRFINSLGPKERLVFSLKVLDNCSYNSICRETNQNLNACRKTFRRARAKWKKFIRNDLDSVYEKIIPDN